MKTLNLTLMLTLMLMLMLTLTLTAVTGVVGTSQPVEASGKGGAAAALTPARLACPSERYQDLS